MTIAKLATSSPASSRYLPVKYIAALTTSFVSFLIIFGTPYKIEVIRSVRVISNNNVINKCTNALLGINS